jgi:hypothetical protein
VSDHPDDQAEETPTVSIGSGGFQPGADDEEADDTRIENAIPEADDEFDWRGWLLVGVVVLAFLVAPALVLLRPVRIIGFQTTYLVLPLIPAFALAVTAVWVAVKSRQGNR